MGLGERERAHAHVRTRKCNSSIVTLKLQLQRVTYWHVQEPVAGFRNNFQLHLRRERVGGTREHKSAHATRTHTTRTHTKRERTHTAYTRAPHRNPQHLQPARHHGRIVQQGVKLHAQPLIKT